MSGPVAQVLAALRERGRPPAAVGDGPRAAARPASRTATLAGGRLTLALPGPRSAAVGVLSMLAFGVVVGSFAPPGVGDLVSAPVVLVMHGIGQATDGGPGPGVAATDSGSGGSGGGAQVAQTITQTIGGGGSSLPAGDGGGLVSYVNSSTSSTTTSSSTSSNILGLPPIKHVFLIVLSGRGYSQTFAPGSADRYLSKTLPAQGALLGGYYGVAGSSATNGIALLTGQGPNSQTAADCPSYTPFAPATRSAHGQYLGQGCVLPKAVPSLPAQLTSHGLTWRAYLQGFQSGAPKADAFGCRRPITGAPDPAATAHDKQVYADTRNPFLYLAAVTSSSDCQDGLADVSALKSDLAAPTGTPSLSYIVPDACHDGSGTVACTPGADPASAMDGFLRPTLAEIEASPAYKADGLIAVTFDQAPHGGAHADQSACCSTPPYPNLPAATTSSSSVTTSTTSGALVSGGPPLSTTTTTTGTVTSTGASTTSSETGGSQTTPTGGGGQLGLVLISRYIKPGTLDVVDDYNHYSLLASVENIFGLPRLGYAAQLGLPVLDAGVFNAYAGG